MTAAMTARRRIGRLVVVGIVGLGLVALAAGVAAARPGGGETYSGGRSSSSGYGGSGGSGAGIFQLIYWLFQLLFAYPAIGLPVLGLVIVLFIYSRRAHRDWQHFDVAGARAAGAGEPDERDAADEPPDASAVRQLDPEFSEVVFEDFAFRLFSTAHRARATAGSLAAIAPYVSEAARTQLAQRAPVGQPVVQVVVGAMRLVRVEVPDAVAPGTAEAPATDRGDPSAARVQLGLEYEANVATATRTYYSVERWLFGRAAGVHSKPPTTARTFPCPNCGAPWQAAQSGTQVCASCGQAVDNGRFDWVVERIALVSLEDRPPTLTAEVAEQGTDLPTYLDRDAEARWQALTGDDPQLTRPALDARLAMIYTQLNQAWSNADLKPVRGLVSDGLYDYLSYWITAYRTQGLRNVLSEMRITRTVLARVARDRYFDAITIRIWGAGKDYVVREPGGQHVRGSRHRDRAYSEYWTLIRSAKRKAAAVTAAACSNCGAPLQITQSGECEHCGAHVTAGEFDWVVSKIEQDDSYRG